MTASFFSLLLMTQVLFAMDFVVASLGAKGEGKPDDSPAIRKAAAAAVSTGEGSRAEFERKPTRSIGIKPRIT